MNIEKIINSVTVSKENLLEAAEQIHKSSSKNRNWDGRSHLLAVMFKGMPNKAMSIDSRLNAISSMIESGKLPDWTIPEQEDGSFLIADPVWETTATEELCFINKKKDRAAISFIFNKQKPAPALSAA